MKKNFINLITIVIAAVFVFSMIPQTTYGQSESKQGAKIEKIKDKTIYKNAKTEAKKAGSNFKEKVKEFEKAGYKITGDHRTLDLAVIEFQNKLDASRGKLGVTVGEANKCRSVDACKQMVQFQAQRELATNLSAEFGGISNQLMETDMATGDEVNLMITAFTRETQANVSGLISPGFSLMKINGDGTNSFITFYFVDLEKMSALRSGALDSSLKETKITIEKAEKIRNFVKQSLEEDEK